MFSASQGVEISGGGGGGCVGCFGGGWRYQEDLGVGFKYLLCSPLPGEMIQFDYIIFSNGLVKNHQLEMGCRLSGLLRPITIGIIHL